MAKGLTASKIYRVLPVSSKITVRRGYLSDQAGHKVSPETSAADVENPSTTHSCGPAAADQTRVCSRATCVKRGVRDIFLRALAIPRNPEIPVHANKIQPPDICI